MKMHKSLCLLVFMLALTVLLTSCNGYNRIMRNHLSDIENYTEYECTFIDFKEIDNGISLIVSLSETPSDNLQYENHFSEEYQTKVSHLEIIASNVKILKENNFFEEIKSGDTILIKASPFIYMDGEFFFIIGVKTKDNSKVYLNELAGLKNMVEMMNHHKSLL